MSLHLFYCLQSGHFLHEQKGGGVAIYIREAIPFKYIDLPESLNLELLCVEIEQLDLIIIVCYRSPQHSKNEFLINLTEYLKQINMHKKILLIGDFNEDSLQSKSKSIEKEIEKLGLENIFKDLPTTQIKIFGE